MEARLASSDLREVAALSKAFGSAARFGPQEATSLAALLIAARSETLCDSIVATLVRGLLLGDRRGRRGRGACGRRGRRPGTGRGRARAGVRGLAGSWMAERVRDQHSRGSAADEEHEQDDPQGRKRARAASVMPAGRLTGRDRRRDCGLVGPEALWVAGLLLQGRALVSRRVRRRRTVLRGSGRRGLRPRRRRRQGTGTAGPGRQAGWRSRSSQGTAVHAAGGATMVYPGPSPGAATDCLTLVAGHWPARSGHGRDRSRSAARTSGRTV